MSRRPDSDGVAARYAALARSIADVTAALQGLTSTEVERAINANIEAHRRLPWGDMQRREVALTLVAGGLVTPELLAALRATARTMIEADRHDRPLGGQEARVTGSGHRWFVGYAKLQRGVYLHRGPLLTPAQVLAIDSETRIKATWRNDGVLRVVGTGLVVTFMPMEYTVSLISGPTPGPWEFAIRCPDGETDRNVAWPADVELTANILIDYVHEKCSAPDRVVTITLMKELEELLILKEKP